MKLTYDVKKDRIKIDGSGTFMLSKREIGIDATGFNKAGTLKTKVLVDGFRIHHVGKNFAGKLKSSFNALKFIWN